MDCKNRISGQRKLLACIFAVNVLLISCSKEHTTLPQPPPPPVTGEPVDVAVHWADMTLYTIRFSSFNSPTYSSRSLGYLGLAMYESMSPI